MGENAQKTRTERLKSFRFKPGNQAAKGKGRPSKTEEQRNFEEWAKGVSEDPEFQDMLRRRAMAGNTEMIKLILFYGQGKPREQRIDPSKIEGEGLPLLFFGRQEKPDAPLTK